MKKRWRFRSHDPARLAQLAGATGLPPFLVQMLLARGLSEPHRAQEFLEARLTQLREPEELPGIPAAAERIAAALEAGERIVVYGDYDVDGMTGTALLCQCLKMLGGDVGFYVPNRMDEGYGLNDEALRTLAEQGARLIITVDCGAASYDQAQTARQLGLDMIVTDHHQFADRLPECVAIVHPRLPGHGYPFGDLSGSGVAFKLAWAVCQRASRAKKVGERMRNFLMQAIGLAALGTVADVVPLLDENRILVRHGLISLRERPSPGLAALLQVAGLADKQRLDSEDIGFALGPRLNACGRLGQAQLGCELLMTSSAERAQTLAEYIDQLNGSRQSLERSVYLAANKQAQEQFDPENDAALVLADYGWHPGVIGIVAGRLAEKFHRPVVLIALDEVGAKPGMGSARSIPGYDLHQALRACSEVLLSHGGHAAAAGLKIDPRQLDTFRDLLCEHAAAERSGPDRQPELWIDAEAPLGAFTFKTLDQLEQMAPFGAGNQRPLLCATGVRLAEPPRRIGSGSRHLSLVVQQGETRLRGVSFGNGDWADELAAVDQPLAIACRPVINEFRGRRAVELQVVDWRLADAPVESLTDGSASRAAG
ncbi:MAG: single-stranded-DNA-specific exonuclease RecJ [Pirellulales bacterium]|nr:single-stranded-DNA-specific exonuclease RecJ [Pirellulales bacterium]